MIFLGRIRHPVPIAVAVLMAMCINVELFADSPTANPSEPTINNQAVLDAIREERPDRSQRVRKIVEEQLKRNPQQAATQLRTRWLPEMQRAQMQEDVAELAVVAVTAAPSSSSWCQQLLQLRTRALLASGHIDAALQTAKSAFNVASVAGSSDALYLVYQCLIARSDPTDERAKLFIFEQTLGARPLGLENESNSILKSIQIDASVYRAAAQSRLQSSQFVQLVEAGNLFLIADEPTEARKAFDRALAIAPANQRTKVMESIACCVKADHGCIGPASDWLAHAPSASSGSSSTSVVLPSLGTWSRKDQWIGVPEVHGIHIDGSDDDWNGQGYEVAIMADEHGNVKPPNDFRPSFRLGWDARGLLVVVRVLDNTPMEYDYTRHLFKGDSVEFFLGRLQKFKAADDTIQETEGDRYMLVMSPGMDPQFPDVRYCFFKDQARFNEPVNYTTTYARQKIPGGYSMEVLLPWSNLGIAAKAGTELAFQLYVMDQDHPAAVKRPSRPPFVAVWYPQANTHVEPASTYRLLLTRQASPPERVTARIQDSNATGKPIVLNVVGVSDFANREVSIIAEQLKAAGTLLAEPQLHLASARIPLPPAAMNLSNCEVSCGESRSIQLQLPRDQQLARAHREALSTTCGFQTNVLTGNVTPQVACVTPWQHPSYTVRYFDAEHQEVDAPTKPGLYGAEIDISGDGGDHARRYATLFRVPAELTGVNVQGMTPSEIGAALLRSNHARRELQNVSANEIDSEQTLRANPQSENAAILLAALQGEGLPPRVGSLGARSQSRQWWVGLKQKLWGMKPMAEPWSRPQVTEGASKPQLDLDAPAAGVSTECLDKIKALLADQSRKLPDEPIVVCFARHGHVFLHVAYGTSDNGPMTVSTQGDLYSLTKSLSATLMMMLVDAGDADLDAPVDRYLPPLVGHLGDPPITIRDLYIFQSGLWGFSDDERNDLEEIVSRYSPYAHVGKFIYNGDGYTLAAKAMEAISGEALPQLYWNHLLKPLGMTHTTVHGSSADARATAMDIAAFGQMLLNRGAYGNLRFLHEETLQRMMPRTAAPGELSGTHGIGFNSYPNRGLGIHAYANGSENSGMMIVDPDHDMVLAIVSCGIRKEFRNCYPALFKMLVSDLQ
ncbi:MAG TPA: serine hydrolase [Pirellulales bacterium]|jgi:CubicO group peptidase (beta-lactamase class C family)